MSGRDRSGESGVEIFPVPQGSGGSRDQLPTDSGVSPNKLGATGAGVALSDVACVP